jgi:ketosteroid isomerase-like protein
MTRRAGVATTGLAWVARFGRKQRSDLARLPHDLADPGAVVARDESGRRCDLSKTHESWLMTLRDGKIVQATMYMDKQEARDAAGLRE